ncbi:MAG: type II toxin-antitoxin system mRNA interferase toxin, RelE/StbE family [Gomphosphaeria aponina SAG 52.96 = DSM 107014]|uniref:Type II toxin-antitoxin system mRNA interferase toxin, RelE/StbE family n=1 Tax=Gomphosphaeria aponina SAG 52.96 = DSM 107014 TaxID=1521640 RepID=A0A941GM05_9CHRO|nr:type II toxin-antitoxin system mRNA interferase toxin, RelE/StbE family [Gomphosphaeria aponina SAG 52.96 = DSM 107014]
MRQLVLTPKFERQFRKFVLHNPKLKQKIKKVLRQMEEYVFDTQLKTHSLQGKLSGLKACSCGYDCRILFAIEIDSLSEKEVVILLDIGTHEEVY